MFKRRTIWSLEIFNRYFHFCIKNLIEHLKVLEAYILYCIRKRRSLWLTELCGSFVLLKEEKVKTKYGIYVVPIICQINMVGRSGNYLFCCNISHRKLRKNLKKCLFLGIFTSKSMFEVDLQKIGRESRTTYIFYLGLKGQKTKGVFTVTCLKKNGSVVRNFFFLIFFFSTQTTEMHMLAAIRLHLHKFCVFKGKRKLKLLITCENFVLFAQFLFCSVNTFLENVEKKFTVRFF